MDERKIIIVTDGDSIARRAVETATTNVGGRCISLSAGNPTWLTGREILELIKSAKHDPVVVMVDDRGKKGVGKGEDALGDIVRSNEVKILGVVAVASNGKDKNGLDVNFSIDKNCNVVENAVDKYGNELDMKKISGDTISILKQVKEKIPLIVGIGDPGKMDGCDGMERGAPITTKALKEILSRN